MHSFVPSIHQKLAKSHKKSAIKFHSSCQFSVRREWKSINIDQTSAHKPKKIEHRLQDCIQARSLAIQK